MNGISFCSGTGGLDLGLERAGVRIVAQCEKDAYRRGVLARHWPGVPCFDDIRSVRLDRGRLTGSGPGLDPGGVTMAGGVDLVAGGTPCQDLSVAGRRAGLIQGERSSLFFEFARIADELVRPGGWLLFENVPGLLSSPGGSRSGRDFAVVLATLADVGFHDLAWRVLDSRYFGVPQRRRRVFIVARRAVGSSARAVLLEPESGGGDFAPSREAGTRVAASLASGSHGAGVSPPGRRQHDDENIVGAIVKRYGKGTDSDATDALVLASTLKAHRGKGGGGLSHEETLIVHTLRAEGFDASEDGTGRGTPLVAGTIRSHQRPGSNSSADILCPPPDPDGVRATPGLSGRMDPPADDYGRCWLCEWAEEHYAERGAGLDEWIADFREAHRCSQSRDVGPDGPRYSAMGDAVTVNVSEWLGERIMSWELANG